MALPLLVIGNPTIDQNVVFGRAAGPRLGGTGAIASLALAGFGNRVVMAGRVGPDLAHLFSPVLEAGVEVVQLPAPLTLRFQNTYPDPARPQRREQRAHAVPPPIAAADLAGVLKRPLAGVVLGPLTPTDLELEVFDAVKQKGAPVAIDVQGFLREVGREGTVCPRLWPEAIRYLSGLSFLHAGDDEAAALLGESRVEPESARRLAERFGIEAVAITRGGDGAWVWSSGEGVTVIPAFRPGPRVEDPTGCGDVFLAAFFHGRLTGWTTPRAGRFAAMAAALSAYSVSLYCASAAEVELALRLVDGGELSRSRELCDP